MLLGIHHDANVPGPDDQIAGLRRTHAHKAFRSVVVQIERTRVGIRIACLLVSIVHQVRTVLRAPRCALAPGRCARNLPPFVRGERAQPRRSRPHRARVLRERRRSRRQQNHDETQSLPHSPSVAERILPRAVLVAKASPSFRTGASPRCYPWHSAAHASFRALPPRSSQAERISWLSKMPREMPEVRKTSAKGRDRKSTRLNSSHLVISYAVFCLK